MLCAQTLENGKTFMEGKVIVGTASQLPYHAQYIARRVKICTVLRSSRYVLGSPYKLVPPHTLNYLQWFGESPTY